MPKLDLASNQFCSETGKQRYPNPSTANQRARVIERDDPLHRPRHTYLCEFCSEWHITRFEEYKPRVDDGSQAREQPRWFSGWRDAARGKIVTPKRFRTPRSPST